MLHLQPTQAYVLRHNTMEVTVKNKGYTRTDAEPEGEPKFVKRNKEKKKTQLRKLQRRKKKENHYA